MMESDGKGQKWGQRPVLLPLLPKGGRGLFFHLYDPAAVAVGALPPPSRRESCMTSDYVR